MNYKINTPFSVNEAELLKKQYEEDESGSEKSNKIVEVEREQIQDVDQKTENTNVTVAEDAAFNANTLPSQSQTTPETTNSKEASLR